MSSSKERSEGSAVREAARQGGSEQVSKRVGETEKIERQFGRLSMVC